MTSSKRRSALSDQYEPLAYERCGKDLLESQYGVFAWVREQMGDNDRNVTAYWACKETCDEEMKKRYHIGAGRLAPWEDIGDLTNPLEYLTFDMRILNSIYRGSIYEREAFEKLKQLKLRIAQVIMVEPTLKERERYLELQMLRNSGL